MSQFFVRFSFLRYSFVVSCKTRIFAVQKNVIMPTVFIFFGYRFLFYSNDHQPIHVHVIKDGCEAKYNVCPIEQIYNHGFKQQQLMIIESIIEENAEVIIERWNNYFNK